MYIKCLQKLTLVCLMAFSVSASYAMENDGGNKPCCKKLSEQDQYQRDLETYNRIQRAKYNFFGQGSKYKALGLGTVGFLSGAVTGAVGGFIIGTISNAGIGSMDDVPKYIVGGGLIMGVVLGGVGAAIGSSTRGLSAFARYLTKNNK